MEFIVYLDKNSEAWLLLQLPFYQSWSKGKRHNLDLGVIRSRLLSCSRFCAVYYTSQIHTLFDNI